MSVPKLDPKSLAGKLRAHALTFPETVEDFPWEGRAIRVKAKAFVFLRAEIAAYDVTVKRPR